MCSHYVFKLPQVKQTGMMKPTITLFCHVAVTWKIFQWVITVVYLEQMGWLHANYGSDT